MQFLIPFTLFLTLATAAPTSKQSITRDDDEKGGPLGFGSDDGVLGTKLFNDDGVNVVSDGKFLGIGNDDGLLNSGVLADKSEDSDSDDDDDKKDD